MGGKLPTEWADVGIQVPGHAHGSVKVFCPKCHDQRKDKTDKSLSVNLEERVWLCHYPQCGWTGRLFDESTLQERSKRSYTMPAEPPPDLSEKVRVYLNKRGLSDYTIRRFKITDGPEWIPQDNGTVNSIRFPYYRDEKLVNIKYRSAKKGFKLAKDAELIFFNLDSISSAEECVITEGEPDCMSVYEAGIKEVVSVPNGASKGGNAKLQYLDNCYEYFTGMKRIVIATDGDTAGLALRDELARRLGKHRCAYIVYPEGCKDCNEVLIRHVKDKANPLPAEMEEGKEEVKRIIQEAIPFPIEGVHQLQDFEQDLDALFHHKGSRRGDTIGYLEFDALFSFKRGQFTVITGIPNNGKSAFLNQVLVRLSSRFGWKHAFCSFENQPVVKHAAKLVTCFLGKQFDDRIINATRWQWGKWFVNEHFFFFNTEDIDLTIEAILEKGKELVMRYGIDSFTIDPWNYVEFNLSRGDTETLFISRALSQVVKFCRTYDVHVFLVAHPVKMPKKGDGFEVPNLYSISGSSHWYSKPDNGLTVHIDETSKLSVVHVQKVREQPDTGIKGNSFFRFEVGTGRYEEPEAEYTDELRVYLQRNGYDYSMAGNDPIDFTQAEIKF